MNLAAVQNAVCQAITALRKKQDERTSQEYGTEEWMDAYHTYKENPESVAVYRGLSAGLSCCAVNVLDVGAGNLMTGRMLCLRNDNIKTYTAVDHKGCPVDHVQSISSCVQNVQIKKTDYRDLKDVPQNSHDVVIVDIEPHGHEVEVYEEVVKYMKPLHLCILKHVGCLDVYGSGLADKFLAKYLQDERVHDYFAESDLEGLRDIFIVMSRFDVTCHPMCQAKAKGKPVQWSRKNGEVCTGYTLN